MIPIKNKKKSLEATVEEMRKFSFNYIEKYTPSKQQLRTYLIKKYLRAKIPNTNKKNIIDLIDIVLRDLEKSKYINDQFYSQSKAKSLIQRGSSINKIRNYLMSKGVNDKYVKNIIDEIKENNQDQDFFSAIKICKKKRIGPSRNESNRLLFYKKDIGVLARAGFIDESLLDTFYGYGSPLGMHPDIAVPGVEMSTGGLGHGLAVGLGMACGAELKGQDFRTFVMLGDGELQEGSNWEAAMAAAHFACNNLTAIVDCNKIQQSGRVSEILDLGTLASKWEAFGWAVREIEGHDMWAIIDALDNLPYAENKPSLLIAHTIKGKGTSFAEDTHVWHNNTVTDAIYQQALDELKESE